MGINDGVQQRYSDGNNDAANQMIGRNSVQFQNAVENRYADNQDDYQTASRIDTIIIINPGEIQGRLNWLDLFPYRRAITPSTSLGTGRDQY